MFDPYHKWFGIPPKDQPPHHYRLLGLETFESDLDVIESSADRLMQFVRQYQSGEHAATAARILNELAKARLCLLKPATKAAYDARLKTEITDQESPAELQDLVFPQPTTARPRRKKKARVFPPHVLLLGISGFVVCLVLFLMYAPGRKSNQNQNSADKQPAGAVTPRVDGGDQIIATDSPVKSPPPSPSDGLLPLQFKWNFQGQRPSELHTRADALPNMFEQVPEGLKITRPQDPDQTAEPVGFVWYGSLQGDFDVIVGFQDFESKTDKADGQEPRFELHMSIGPPNATLTNSALIGQRQRPGELAMVSGLGELDADGNHLWRVTELPTQQNAGRLRLIRTGTAIQALTAPSGSEAFVPMARQIVGDQDVTTITFVINSESKNSSARITLNEFSIRGGRLRRESSE